MLSDYKDALGKPGEGIHSHFGLGFAVIDVALTALAAYILSSSFNIGFIFAFLILIVLGIAMHYIFGVQTALNRAIGLA